MFNLPKTGSVQEGLQQAGNTNFYYTPNTPADPQDCNRYPNSPWCGENPINQDGVDFGLEVVIDECNIGLSFSPVLGFISLPTFQFVYRSSDVACQTPPVVPPPPPQNEETPTIPPPNCGDNFLGLILSVETLKLDEYFAIDYFEERSVKASLVYAVRPGGETIFDTILGRFVQVTARIGIEVHVIDRNAYEGEVRDVTVVYHFVLTEQGLGIGDIAGNTLRLGTEELAKFYFYYDTFVAGCAISPSTYSYVENEQESHTNLRHRIAYSICTEYNPPRVKPPSPPLKKDMACCEETNRLLRLVLQRIGPLPASVPNSLVKANSGALQIQSLAQFIAYSVKQTNAQFGQFPQEITIQDADLTQEGNQEKKVKLPNVAESIAEIVGLLLFLQSESNATLIASINGMIEAGSAKQAAILAGDYSKANSEYLGFKGKQIEHNVPFTFKPGETKLDQMLKQGEVRVKGFENDDKEDLNDHLAPLLEMAAMYRAANFRNLGAGEPLAKLTALLRGASIVSDALEVFKRTPPPPDPNNPNAPEPEIPKTDWEQFVEDAETGFIAQPGITDAINPYNRPLDQRPKIREIGNDTSEST